MLRQRTRIGLWTAACLSAVGVINLLLAVTPILLVVSIVSNLLKGWDYENFAVLKLG